MSLCSEHHYFYSKKHSFIAEVLQFFFLLATNKTCLKNLEILKYLMTLSLCKDHDKTQIFILFVVLHAKYFFFSKLATLFGHLATLNLRIATLLCYHLKIES
jgi:hypothetical protein